MLKQRLTDEKVHDLSLIVAAKASPDSDIRKLAEGVYEAYMKSFECYKELNREYSEAHPPGMVRL